MPDDSCYVTFINKLNVDLTLISQTNPHGDWEINPDSTIKAGATSKECHLKDRWLAPGAEGSFTYSFTQTNMATDQVTCYFHCPWGGANTFTTTVNTNTVLFAVSNDPAGDTSPLRVTATISYNTNIPIALTINQVATASVRAFPLLNSRKSVVGGSVTSAVTLWTPATSDTVKDNINPSINGSYNCVGFPLSSSNSLAITVDDDPTNSQLKNVPLLLEGILNGKTIVSVGDIRCNSVAQAMLPIVNNPCGWAGDVQWRFTVQPSGQVYTVSSTTRVEIYNIASLSTFYQATAIDIALLRVLVLPSVSNAYLTSLINTCFSNFKFVYDTENGASRYTSRYGGSYRLTNWLAQLGTGAIVNCYDMAGIVQIGLAFMVGDTSWTWCFQRPFGYINPTVLIGVPNDCNNPFFNSYSPPAPQLCGVNDPTRTGFDNHAYVLTRDGLALDACAGPRVGTPLATYVSQAIDTTTTLTKYHTGSILTAGKHIGLTTLNKINATDILAGSNEDEKTVIAQMLKLAANPSNNTISYSNSDLSALPNVVLAAFPGGTLIVGPVFTVDVNASRVMWMFKAEEIYVEMVVETHTEHREAVEAMSGHLTGYQRQLEDVLEASPQDQERGQFSLVSKAGDTVAVWVEGNLFTTITGWSAGEGVAQVSVNELGKKVDEHMLASTVAEGSWKRPKVSGVHGVPTEPVSVGSSFKLFISVSEGTNLKASTDTGNAIPVDTDQRGQSVEVLARFPGKDVITLSFIHPFTFAVTSVKVEVEVVE